MSTSPDTLIICAYPVSSEYEQSVRFLIYPLILGACCYSRAPWLATGCLSTYCGVAAIHLFAMAAVQSKEVLDLDSYMAFHICVMVLIICPTVIDNATSLRVRSRRYVFCAFTFLLWIGTVSFAAMVRYNPSSQPCLDVTQRAVSKNETQDVAACVSACPQHTLRMRSGQTPQNVV